MEGRNKEVRMERMKEGRNEERKGENGKRPKEMDPLKCMAERVGRESCC